MRPIRPVQAVWLGVPVVLLAFACGDTDGQGSGDGSAPTFADAQTSNDAAAVDCVANHRETLESDNDGVIDDTGRAEPTDLVVGPSSDFTICGEVSTTQTKDGFADVDVFAFEVASERIIRFELQSAAVSELGGLRLALFSADGPAYLGSGRVQARHGAITRSLAPGSYWLAVLAEVPAPGEPIAYQLRVRDQRDPCPTLEGDPEYVESFDGTGRGNDVIEVNRNSASIFSLTSTTDDEPEATEFSLQPGGGGRIDGTAADVATSHNYLDRDTYLLSTGSDTDELTLRLTWDSNAGANLDLLFFRGDDLTEELTFDMATTTTSNGSELVTMAVLPSEPYWLWIGMVDHGLEVEMPVPYSITVCPTRFENE